MSPSLAASFRWPEPEGGPDVFRQELFARLKFALNYLMVTAAPENLSEARCARWLEGLAGLEAAHPEPINVGASSLLNLLSFHPLD